MQTEISTKKLTSEHETIGKAPNGTSDNLAVETGRHKPPTNRQPRKTRYSKSKIDSGKDNEMSLSHLHFYVVSLYNNPFLVLSRFTPLRALQTITTRLREICL
jgi:hypothetical protein